MVQALKYRYRLAVAEYFTRALAGLGRPDGVDVLLPMPLHVARLRERGFNQAVEITRPLAREWALPLELAQVGRVLDVAPQASLAWRERIANMRGVFCCDGMLAGRSVLVIDDVMTTGATLDALARILKRHGAVRVENLVVARTLP
jgi:predicted amidophosphoribosyltransferase